MLLQALALAWLCGTAAAALGIGVAAAPAALVVGLWGTRRLGRRLTVLFLCLLATISIVGARAYERSTPRPTSGDIATFIATGPARVRGVVGADRDERQRALYLILDVSEAEDAAGWRPVHGRLLVRVGLSLPYDYGDLIEVRGRVTGAAQSSGSDYRAYLARQGIYAEMNYPATRLIGRNYGNAGQAALVHLRERLAEGIISVLPEPEASLGAGIALGSRRVIEPGLNAALTSTGTAQIVVASGYNITVVSLFTIGAIAWAVGRRPAALLSLAAIWSYGAFVGLYPSVVRAAIMGSIVALAAIVGRPHRGLRALIIATAIMVWISPQTVHDLSFLLSLSGTAGLFLLVEPIERALWRLFRIQAGEQRAGGPGGIVIESAATTLAATIATLPVLLVVFHTLSISSLPANMLLFPLVPAIMAASVATAIAGAFWHPAALLLAPLAWLLLSLMVLIVRACASLPGGYLQSVWFDGAAAIGYYGLIGSSLMLGPARRARISGAVATCVRRLWMLAHARAPALLTVAGTTAQVARPSRTPVVAARGLAWVLGLLLGIGPGVVGGVSSASSANHLQVTYLDVGAGTSVLVQAGGSRILVDGGPSGQAAVRALDRVLPPWERALNLVVLTSRAEGRAGGLAAVLSRYRIEAVVDATSPPSASEDAGPAWRAWEVALSRIDVLRLPPSPVTSIQAGAATLRIIPSGRSTDSSGATVIVQVGARRLLLAGGPDPRSDLSYMAASRETSTWPRALVEVLEARQASRAEADLAALPAAARAALVYRTLEHGEIALSSDGKDLRVSTSRGPRLGLFGAPR